MPNCRAIVSSLLSSTARSAIIASRGDKRSTRINAIHSSAERKVSATDACDEPIRAVCKCTSFLIGCSLWRDTQILLSVRRALRERHDSETSARDGLVAEDVRGLEIACKLSQRVTLQFSATHAATIACR